MNVHPRARRGPPPAPDNKQKAHDNKRVNDPANNAEKKYQPVGAEKDLVEGLERDIVQKNPNVRW